MNGPVTTAEDAGTIPVSVAGQQLLHNPLLNKGSAFTAEERVEFDLLGLLPPHVSTMEEQLARTYANYRRETTPLARHVYLRALHDRNEVLYFRLLLEHITEMMPVIYTPVVGEACQRYSHLYRVPRGLHLAYPDRDQMERVLHNVANSSNGRPASPRVIVVTDGERILGLGDLGVGGLGIPVGKLSLYTLCAGIHPATTLPVVLDVGTNNQELLEDPLYLGWRHERLRGEEYDAFIEQFVMAVKKHFPGALLQWEDFAKSNASRLLDRYRDTICSFNDDIQGTGAVTLAGILTATARSGGSLRDHTLLLFGSGSAARGISDQVVSAMRAEGLSDTEARDRIWLLDSRGLVHSERDRLDPFKRAYAQPVERIAGWEVADRGHITLAEVVRHARPTILIGTAATPGAFGEEIVREMARHTERPLIFPLSNPTSKSEATPEELIRWTEGRALVATGSPFAPVSYEGQTFVIGQCNNSFIFPGVGLGVVASGARRVTDEMFVAAARALSDFTLAHVGKDGSLFPTLETIRDVSRQVAIAVGREAQAAGLAEETTESELKVRVDGAMWYPAYPRLRRLR